MIRLLPAALCLISGFALTGVAQLCGQWQVQIEVVNSKAEAVNNATVEYVDVPEGDAAAHHPFTPKDGSPNILVSTFSEGERASKSYNLQIRAAGYDDLLTSTKVTYCYRTQETKRLEQQKTSTLIGVVYDASGAVIAGARVVAVDPKGKKVEVATNDVGEYLLTLPITATFPSASYDIQVSSRGFQTAIVKRFVFVAGFHPMRLDVALDVGTTFGDSVPGEISNYE